MIYEVRISCSIIDALLMDGLKRLSFPPDRAEGAWGGGGGDSREGGGSWAAGCGLSVCHRTAALHCTAATDGHFGIWLPLGGGWRFEGD